MLLVAVVVGHRQSNCPTHKQLSRRQDMDNLKGLLAKCWKNEKLELEPDHHDFDE